MQIMTKGGFCYTIHFPGLILALLISSGIFFWAWNSDRRICGAVALPHQHHYMFFTYQSEYLAALDNAVVLYSGPCKFAPFEVPPLPRPNPHKGKK